MDFNISNARVLEVLQVESNYLQIGCGLGECASICVKSGASALFQDYNESVISKVCGIHQQTLSEIEKKRCRYFYGSWEDLLIHTSEESFDIILGSEILYNEENYPLIVNILTTRLSAGGIAIIATKNMYFGLSGSIFLFLEHLNKTPGIACKTIETHKRNIPRSILLIRKADSNGP